MPSLAAEYGYFIVARERVKLLIPLVFFFFFRENVLVYSDRFCNNIYIQIQHVL